MRRHLRLALFVLLLASSLHAQGHLARQERQQPATWYEQLLQRINPQDVDYGATWEQRKQEFINQLGNPYFQYSVGATVAALLLLIITIAQRLSHQRSLDIAAQSLTDVLHHDAYSRQVADEAIQRYNRHIESCNRVIELGQDGMGSSTAARESTLQSLKRQLSDIRQENLSLREELARKSQPATSDSAPAEPSPAKFIERINALEKQLRAEQRKNQQAKGTSVDDHRA